jgi:Glycoside-hydrolase family GH114
VTSVDNEVAGTADQGRKVDMRTLLAVVVVLVGAAACAGPPEQHESAPTVPVEVHGFPAGAAADYQLGGVYPPPEGVRLVVRDSTAMPAQGAYNVCYVNGFQTQPGERDRWLRERHDLVLFDPSGKPVVDENWPDELILDTSTADKRTQLAGIIGEAVKSCAAKGFDAVEFDNLDSYSRSGGALTVADNMAFAGALATAAHRVGLVVGQKNSAELGMRGKREAGFGFAVAEECLRFDECGAYAKAFGDSVMDIEYTDDLPGSADSVCARPDRPKSTIIRDRKLVTPDSPDYFYRRC